MAEQESAERALATVATLGELRPIAEATAIELATLLGRCWQVVVNKSAYDVGERGVYFEIDSVLPVRPEFERLRKRCWARLPDGSEGFRLRTARFCGQLSQGFFLSAAELGLAPLEAPDGADLTLALGVRLWPERPLGSGAAQARGRFPSCVPKTNEPRVQNLVPLFEELRRGTVPLRWTEKLDGTSFTALLDAQGQFRLCSRNQELRTEGAGVYSFVAQRCALEAKLRRRGQALALQGEIVGPGVQGNPYRLGQLELYLFTAYDIAAGQRLDVVSVAAELGLQTVPVLEAERCLPASVAALLQLADGESRLAPRPREGLVLRSRDGQHSFKVISNDYLLKQK